MIHILGKGDVGRGFRSIFTTEYLYIEMEGGGWGRGGEGSEVGLCFTSKLCIPRDI